MHYAIIDLETTGLNPSLERITEVAILVHDGQRVVNRFISLVNPEKRIPYHIREMTGITDAMVANAPRFCEIAREIIEITEGCIFVAHNAPFDHGFIRAEYARLGYHYDRKTLCTRRLSRKLFPNLKSYSLGNLCQHFHIRIESRHRAFGDAEATVQLFEQLLQRSPSPESLPLKGVPSHVAPEKIKAIPQQTGVYYLHNSDGDVLYVGKSINLRDRVMTHLSNDRSKRGAEMREQIHDITWEVCGSELIALLLEAEEVKKHMPRFNRLLRRKMLQWGLYLSAAPNGYLNLVIKKNEGTAEAPLTTFPSKKGGTEFLFQLVEDHSLCQKLCGLYKTRSGCFHQQIGKCRGACTGEEDPDAYNARVQQAIAPYTFVHHSFIIIDEGRSSDEKSVVMVEDNRYCGYGFLRSDEAVYDPEHLKNFISIKPDHRDAQQIIRTYMKQQKPERVIRIEAPQHTSTEG